MSQEGHTERRPGYLVKRVQQLLRHECDRELRDGGVTISQYAVLRALDEHPGASSAELARLCFVTRQSLQDVLSGLRSNGLVEVADRPTTGRARPARLTPLGVQRLARAGEVMASVEDRMLAGFGAEERDLLSGLLIRCTENLAGGSE
ncbi:MarR family winged helix-turn-helix transcriptional regulator [Saccharopolyspora gloriosae]|uniref:MarR family winged helix-turn-helix transcriptional regulator n=1 Tax=Saccharopolyspora gloriosae TaxID=455344 RepID=UPI001FB6A5B4|nr:MarR family transcriptional regulator [Saccharopolyspora gloriosae]